MASADGRNTKRFNYTACTVGVGAVLTSHLEPATGVPMAESWAPACLPVIGGRSGSVVNGPVVWPTAADYASAGLPNDGPVLQFARAATKITGRLAVGTPQHEEYETVIQKTVTNLRILNRLTANLDVEIKYRYKRRPTPAGPAQRDPIDVSLNVSNFVITTPGAVMAPPLPNPITLNRDIPRSAGANFKKFLQGPASDPDSLKALRPGKQHHSHEHGESGNGGHRHGAIYTALVEPVALPFTYDEATLDFGRFDVPLSGLPNTSAFEVYVGEWYGQPYWQSLTFLRVELKNVTDPTNPAGPLFSGEIVIDDGDDGQTYP